MIKQKFLGRWKLKSIIVKYDDTVIYPFGREINAILFYDELYMSVQIMMPLKKSLEHLPENGLNLKDLAWALKNIGYMGYFGKYEIDEEMQQIKHHVEGAIVQSLVGGTEIRNYRFENDEMILSAGPMQLKWVRLD
ncbi:MAG: lipocalin-like domain-containing protein [Ignavibacteria bacterium]|nr:lipocalin-like domain-containing protein [Ignavibacteria bacterium]